MLVRFLSCELTTVKEIQFDLFYNSKQKLFPNELNCLKNNLLFISNRKGINGTIRRIRKKILVVKMMQTTLKIGKSVCKTLVAF